jgi:uncharacterized membrane protein
MAGGLSLAWNINGQFSDIRGFYGIHFLDGENDWPLAYHNITSNSEVVHPVEYPSITALIIWILSFLVQTNNEPWLQYFRITAVLNGFLLVLAAQILAKQTGKKLALLFLFSPAVLYSLNRNWDIWAIVSLAACIYFFEKEKFKISAIWLAISVSTNFFPIFLLIPICIYFYRINQRKMVLVYLTWTASFFSIINIPFAIINLEGWLYFYKFNFSRGLGSASIFEVLIQLGWIESASEFAYYALNLTGILALIFILAFSKKIFKLSESSFAIFFVIMFFNKQYSMQYVIWLTFLAVLALSRIDKSTLRYPIYFFICWQATEFMFQYVFFQNILADIYAGITNDPMGQMRMSYALTGVIRYTAIALFLFVLMSGIIARRREALPQHVE